MIKPVNNGNRGANLKSNRPEAAESQGKKEKGSFAETGVVRRHRSWGTVEEAVHSHRKVEELLLHGMWTMKQWYFVPLLFICQNVALRRLVQQSLREPVTVRRKII